MKSSFRHIQRPSGGGFRSNFSNKEEADQSTIPARDTRMTISIIRPPDSDQRKRGVSDYTGMQDNRSITLSNLRIQIPTPQLPSPQYVQTSRKDKFQIQRISLHKN
ncbi:hypothetical protein pb186bvf_009617 [Paramecium bursaria]